MIQFPENYKTTISSAWANYVSWIKSIFPNDLLRLFFLLENFTKLMIQESHLMADFSYYEYWLAYIDMSLDGIDILKYMKNNNTYSNYYGLYDAFAYIYEKHHDFKLANEAYLEGIEKQVYKVDILKKLYKAFETRMQTRIDREIKESVFSKDSINMYISNELARVI